MTTRSGHDLLTTLLADLAGGNRPPAVMGVVNITPDSFSDGGRFLDPQAARDQALALLDQGAEIVDIGAESTRPGSDPVSPEEQIRRAVPVIEAVLGARPETLVSIDTQSALVARAALGAGAVIVNDVSALVDDTEMVNAVAEFGAGVVLMHMRGRPRTMQTAGGGPVYEDVVGEVRDYLRERIAFTIERGVDRGRIMADPGLGFGKTVEHNLQLMRDLAEFATLGVPILVGASRKTFIGRITGVETPVDRLGGSLACAAIATAAGAAIIRAHDVAATRQAVVVSHAISSAAHR